MGAGDTARTNYEKAKDESIQRIQIRDHILLAYLGAVGTIFGIALASAAVRAEVLLIIPYLTLGAAILVAQHNSMIGAIGSYIALEVIPALDKIGEGAQPWERSKALQEYSSRMILSRSVGHLILLIIPAGISLAMNYQHSFQLGFPYSPVWWFGLVATGLALYVLFESDMWRRSLHRKTGRFPKDRIE